MDNPSVPDNGPDEKQRQQPQPQHHEEQGPSFAAAEPRVLDLSEEIARSLARSAGDRITCRRIAGNNYRCNWWAPQGLSDYDNPAVLGQMVTTHRVRRSELLRVTKTREGKLLIETVSGVAR